MDIKYWSVFTEREGFLNSLVEIQALHNFNNHNSLFIVLISHGSGENTITVLRVVKKQNLKKLN